MSKKIAIIEDEDTLAQNYKAGLERAGYLASVYPDRETAQNSFEASLPDLAIIDIQLGNDKEGGYKLCDWLRSKCPTLPIIFYSAHASEIYQLAGAAHDADEYLIKDQISIKLLSARVAALLRLTEARKNQSVQTNVMNRGPLHLDIDHYTATWNGQKLDLTFSEFRVVECLIRRDRVCTRDQLMSAIDMGKIIDPNSMNAYIKRIRKKIRELDPDAEPIESMRSVGYRWVVN